MRSNDHCQRCAQSINTHPIGSARHVSHPSMNCHVSVDHLRFTSGTEYGGQFCWRWRSRIMGQAQTRCRAAASNGATVTTVRSASCILRRRVWCSILHSTLPTTVRQQPYNGRHWASLRVVGCRWTLLGAAGQVQPSQAIRMHSVCAGVPSRE